MQYLENDMDELFRKAADNYPLKTDASDWDKIAPALAKTRVSAISRHATKRKYAYLFLLGFVLLTSASLVLFFNPRSNLTGTYSPSSEWKKETSEGKTTSPGISQSENSASMDLVNKTAYLKQGGNSITPKAKQLKPLSGKKLFSNPRSTDPIFTESGMAFNPASSERIEFNFRVKPVILSKKVALTTGLISNPFNKTIGEDISQNLPLPVGADRKSSFNKQGFYFGIVTGPQLNQVRSQGFNKPSLSSGVIVGYEFNKRVSIETGLFFTKKHYLSEGKYFDMEKAKSSMPSGMKVLSLKGNSAVFEIPVKLKFDFLRKTNSSFFATAGISSYLLSKESNDYLALINGTQQRMIGNYQNATKYFAGSINFSAGYNQKIGKQLSIRMEPYIQMPIQGLGVGAMPVSSAGLHIGIIWDRK